MVDRGLENRKGLASKLSGDFARKPSGTGEE